MGGTGILIVIYDTELGQKIEVLVAAAPWGRSNDVQLRIDDSGARSAVEKTRERSGGIPLGYIARDEPSALQALEAGADDACVLEHPDSAQLAVFLDRVKLRARLRAESQRLHNTFAHAEKLTALGTLVAGVGHEINNPLSAITLYLDAARRRLLPHLPEKQANETLHMLDDMTGAAESIASIVRDLRVFARSDDNESPELVEVEDLVAPALRLVGHELSHRAIVERDYAADLPKLVLPRNKLTQVIVNLLVNAAHAITESERDPRVRISARADEDFVVLAISDSGPGIPSDSLTRIFDPFFTTKRAEHGTGLGLSISQSIMRSIGGELGVESVYGEGATFLCFIPRPTQEMLRAAWRHSSLPVSPIRSRSQATLLVIDDDPRMLRSYVRMLGESYRVITAEDGNGAIELLHSGTEPDAIVTELSLPERDGCDVLDFLAENNPSLRARTLIVTSAASSPTYAEFLRKHEGPVLHKPVRGAKLLAALDMLIDPAK